MSAEVSGPSFDLEECACLLERLFGLGVRARIHLGSVRTFPTGVGVCDTSLKCVKNAALPLEFHTQLCAKISIQNEGDLLSGLICETCRTS